LAALLFALYGFCNSSGSLAMFAAIGRDNSFAADERDNSFADERGSRLPRV
jgi:hypothetical protein